MGEPWCSRALLLLFVSIAFSGVQLETAAIAATTSAGCSTASVSARLTDALLAEYERDERPRGTPLDSQPGHPANTTMVGFDVTVRNARIDETTATAQLLIDIFVVWIEDRLMWNTTEWGVDAIYVDADRLWKPDMQVLNAVEARGTDEPARVTIRSDGGASWLPRYDVAVPCQLTLDAWPRDEHLCQFELGSRIYPNDAELYMFRWYKKFTEDLDHVVGPWQVSIVKSELLTVTRDTQDYSAAVWTLRIRRRGGAHALAAAAVTTTLLALLTGAMLLPAENRAPLHAAAALVACAHICTAVLRLPAAASTPRVLRLHAVLLVLAGAGAICTALVVRVSRLRTRLSPALHRLVRRTAFISNSRKAEGEQQEAGGGRAGGGGAADAGAESSPAGVKSSGDSTREWSTAARLLDLAFSALGVLALIVVLSLYW